MNVTFYNVPLSNDYNTVVQTANPDVYLSFLDDYKIGEDEYPNMVRLTPSMDIVSAVSSPTYVYVRDDGETYGDFYFVENTARLSANAYGHTLTLDIWQKYCLDKVTFTSSTWTRGHNAKNNAPFAVPITYQPPVDAINVRGYYPNNVSGLYRVIAVANLVSKSVGSGGSVTIDTKEPLTFISEPTAYFGAMYLVDLLAPLASVKLYPNSTSTGVSYSVVNYSGVWVIPDDFLTYTPVVYGDSVTLDNDTDQIKYFKTIAGTDDTIFAPRGRFVLDMNAAAFSFDGMAGASVSPYTPRTDFEIGDILAVGTIGHVINVPNNGTLPKLVFDTTVSRNFGVTVFMRSGDETVDVSEDFAVPFLQSQTGSAYTADFFDKQALAAIIGVAQAGVAIGGTIASGGALAPVLIPTALGGISAMAQSAHAAYQEYKKPYSISGGGKMGAIGGMLGGILVFYAPAANKAEITDFVKRYGADYRKTQYRQGYPTKTIMGGNQYHYYVKAEDCDAVVYAGADIKAAVESIFLRGVTIASPQYFKNERMV